jgi:hypothetical protein
LALLILEFYVQIWIEQQKLLRKSV